VVWIGLLIGLIALAMILGFNARKFYHKWVDWQCGRVAAEVTHLLKDDKVEQAFKLAGETFRKYPDNTELLRLLAKMLVEVSGDGATAASLLKRLHQQKRATDVDLLLLAHSQAQSADLVGAQETLSILPPQLQQSRKALEARAILARSAGDESEAERLLRAAFITDPTDRMAQLMLAKMDQSKALQSGQEIVARRIWDLAQGNDKAAKEAIRHIANSETTTSTEIVALVKLMESHPLTDDELRYAVLFSHHRLRPLDSSRLVQDEITRNKGRAATDLSDFFIWLGKVGQHQRILELLPLMTAKRDSKSLLIYVDALAAAQQWTPLIDLMDQPEIPISDVARNLVRAQSHGLAQAQDLSAAFRFLKDSIVNAGIGDKEILQRAIGVAESLGFNDLAREGITRLLEMRPGNRQALLEKQLELARRDRDVPGMLQTLSELTSMKPGQNSYSDQLHYLRLLSGEGMELSASLLESAAPDVPQSSGMPRAALRAMAARRFGDEEKLRDAIAEVDAPERLNTGIRALLAGYYAELGQREKAYRLGETLVGDGLRGGDKTNLLLPEELRHLENAMR
jgi:thioredoxin-like negative regulator of GroEL